MSEIFPWRIEPFKHQIPMAEWAYEHPCSFDLSDVGCGKTAPMIMALQRMFAEGRIARALVVCPKSIMDNWANEIQKNSHLKAIVVRGDRMRKLLSLSLRYQVYILNYESTWRLQDELASMGFDALVLDEAHHAKDAAAKQTKALLALAPSIKVRKAMTGTLLTNDLQDVWSIAQIVNPRIFATNRWGFRGRYLQDKNAGQPWKTWPDWVPREGATEEVRKKLEPHAIRFEKKEVLKFLPPVLFEKRSVEIAGEQKRVYNELKKEFIADLDNGSVLVAADILPRISKMLQVTSGFLYIPDQDTYHFKENAKMAVLEEVLDSIGDQRVCIWAAFTEDIYAILTGLQREVEGGAKAVGVIHGSTKDLDRQSIVDRFNAGDLDVLICNAQCAGEGLTILAPYAIYYSRSWKLGERLQSLGRHDRPGAEQFENVTIFDLVCEGTLDAQVLKALEGKEDLLKSINPRRVREMV